MTQGIVKLLGSCELERHAEAGIYSQRTTANEALMFPLLPRLPGFPFPGVFLEEMSSLLGVLLNTTF